MTPRATCRCGWEYVALTGRLIPVHPRASAPVELCDLSMAEAPADAPVRTRAKTVAHLRGVVDSLAAMIAGEPERTTPGLPPEVREALDHAWAAYRARKRRARATLDAVNHHARALRLRGWRAR